MFRQFIQYVISEILLTAYIAEIYSRDNGIKGICICAAIYCHDYYKNTDNKNIIELLLYIEVMYDNRSQHASMADKGNEGK
jgi:HD superfamily phosphohydrolase YqeK